MSSFESNQANHIAIIGMAGKFPGAKNIDEYWRNLTNGVESVKRFTDDELRRAGISKETLDNPQYIKAKAILDEVDMFDADFFDINPREAEIMDPQHRMFLESAWAALEDSGTNPEYFPGRIGVYSCTSINTYLFNNLYSNKNLIEAVGFYQTMIGNDKDYLPTKVSYQFNLKGPSIAILNGECDIALAGGVAVRVPQTSGYFHKQGGIHSFDGHCRPFDINGSGIVSGNGLGIVILKRLEDAINDNDYIYAVIKGSAVNNDGSQKIGYTAPSVQGQSDVIKEACEMADVDPETISYVEAHGTATPLGDPIEVAALTAVYRERTNKKNYCGLGSVKSNIGHIDAASGIAGLIKTTLALHRKEIPPSINFIQPNPKLNLEDSPFYINNTLKKWDQDEYPRRAAVSSFGIGGTNAHLVLEEAPVVQKEENLFLYPAQLLTFSAKSSEALKRTLKNFADYLYQNQHDSISDVGYTLQTGRKAFNYRFSITSNSIEEAYEKISETIEKRLLPMESLQDPDIIFMFPGQGSQFVNMGKELYMKFPIFRDTVDYCARLLKIEMDIDIRDILYPSKDREEWATKRINDTEITQPCLFVIGYSLAKLWGDWGIQPKAMIGHSIGEYIAACLSGVLSLADALKVVAKRGKLMGNLTNGSMVSVYISEDEVKELLNKNLSIAAINGEKLCVVSGSSDEIENFIATLERKNISYRLLKTSHAFHSQMMDPILEDFMSSFSEVQLSAPKIPIISSLTGTWLTSDQAKDPHYWKRQLRETVQFHKGIKEASKEPNLIFLEIGPGRTLSTLTNQVISRDHKVVSSLDKKDLTLIESLGKVWSSGYNVDWNKYYQGKKGKRIPLPTYPFERAKFWVHPIGASMDTELSTEYTNEALNSASIYSRPELTIDYVAPKNKIEEEIVKIWKELLGIDRIGIYDNFFDLGGHSLLATQLVSRIRNVFDIDIQLQDLFKVQTVEKLAMIVQTYQNQLAQDLLEEIKSLSNDEIAGLLAIEKSKGKGNPYE